MITREEIELLGFEYSDELSSDEVEVYFYEVIKKNKPKGTKNVYRLNRLIDTDYFNLVSDLERLPEFVMWTRGFNGELEDITELFNLFESFKDQNRKI